MDDEPICALLGLEEGMFKMKSGFVALLLVLALTSCSAAAVDLRWQRPQEGELQGMEYAAGYKPQQEMSYDQGRNELGQEHDSLRDLPYGFMEKSIQQEIGIGRNVMVTCTL